MAFSQGREEEAGLFGGYYLGSADLGELDPAFVEESELRSVGPAWAMLPPLPPIALETAHQQPSERIRAAAYETVNTQLPPLEYRPPPSQIPDYDLSSPFLRRPVPDCITSPSPPPHDRFVAASSDHQPTGADGLSALSTPNLLGPSISVSSSSAAAPRAAHHDYDSFPFAQSQHSPSLPQLRFPANLSESPTQLPDPIPIGSPPGPEQEFLDYMSHYYSARYASTLQELDDFAYVAANDILSPTLLFHSELYQNDDSSPFAANAALGSRSQLPAADAGDHDPGNSGLAKTEPGLFPNDDMPSTSRLSESSRPGGIRKRPPPAETAEASLKRRRTPGPTSSRARSRIETNRTRFGASSTGRKESVEDSKSGFGDDDEDDVQIIDLSNTETVPEELLIPAVDTSTKLSGYECIICMDRCTDITVTHCGHLFCGNCLHQSINMNPDKKICPICRQKLDLRPSNGRAPSKTAKTYFHLELKLMPKNRQGKMPATR